MEIIVAAIIQKGNRFLLTRQAKGAHHEGLWGFPGGKVEKNESLEVALKREVKEETGLDISVGELFHAVIVEKENALILFLKSDATTEEVKPRDDIDKFAWVTLEEIKKYKMRSAMYEVIEKLKSSPLFLFFRAHLGGLEKALN
jgi:8-oxo-dGTP diphosphatase